MKIRFGLFVFFYAVALAGTFYPGESYSAAWTLPYGTTQVIDTYSVYTTEFTNVFIEDNGVVTTVRIEQERFIKAEYQPLVEVGASNDLTIGISPSLQHVTSYGTSGYATNWGLASTDIFFRKKLWEKDAAVFSVQPLIKWYGIYDESDSPSLGPKQVDLELRGLVGNSFMVDNKWHYFNAEAAYRKRFEEPSDEIRGDLTLGYRFLDGFTIMPQIFATFAVNQSSFSDRIAVNSNDYDLVKFQLSVVEEVLPDVSVQFGIFAHVYARNTGGAAGVAV